MPFDAAVVVDELLDVDSVEFFVLVDEVVFVELLLVLLFEELVLFLALEDVDPDDFSI
jgi:hypothetical protein